MSNQGHCNEQCVNKPVNNTSKMCKIYKDIFYPPQHYDDVDILPSSSLFDESYPEFYGDQCLSKQFL